MALAGGLWPLLQVLLRAEPLLLFAQGAIAGQVHAAVGATHHWLCARVGRFFRRLEAGFVFAPEPHASRNQSSPDQ